MVGVARSRGCRTCVKRRVKCDQARPICNNCVKGQRDCPGYNQGVKFQDEGPRLRDKFKSNANAETDISSRPSAGTQNTSTTSSNSPDFVYDDDSWSSEEIDFTDVAVSRNLPQASMTIDHMSIFALVENETRKFSNLNIRPELHKSFLRDPTQLFNRDKVNNETIGTFMYSPMMVQNQMLQEFMNAVAPTNTDFIPMAMKSTNQWMNNLPGLSGVDTLLDNAIRAVTLIHIGRFHQSDRFLEEARPYYGRALRLLNKAIADPVMGMSNITLCATVLLSFYEMFASDNDASWIRHAGGASTLMKLRGADRHRTGFDRDIFLAYRHTLVIEAFQRDEPSFLAEPEWQQLAIDLHDEILAKGGMPQSKRNIFDTAEMLHRCLVQITCHAARAEQLSKAPTPSPTKHVQTTFADLAACRLSLLDTFNAFRAAVAAIGQSPTTIRTTDPIMPISYIYGNVFLSLMHVGFYQALTLCNLNMDALGAQLVPQGLVTDHELDIYRDENQQTALKMCRSVNFMLRSSFLGPFYAVFALRMAGQVFEPGTLERDWTIAKLYEIGDRSILFAKYIPWFNQTGQSKDKLLQAIARVKRRQECIEYE